MAIALVTGASQGLGRALAKELAERGWSLVLDARHGDALEEAQRAILPHLAPDASLVTIVGDVADAGHRRDLVRAAEGLGGLDLLVNNASTLGATPLPGLLSYPLDELTHALEINVVAPLALAQEAMGLLRRSTQPAVVNITSDASVEPYAGWGGYGLSKAALDHMSAVLAVEEPSLMVWAVDPGDMRTQMHHDAFPGEDISDRPWPSEVVPDLVHLVEARPPSGRYRLSDLRAARELVLETESS
jgi:NAD(P)-dependent dehydrogenase (short-subunit alcohol dehydrogenase family)